MSTCEIYGIYDAEGALRYVGKAKNSLKRFRQHLRENRRATPFYNWLRKAVADGQTPTVKVLEVCPADAWEAAEKEHIFKARLENANLLNLADGGDEPKQTRERRRKNAIGLNEGMRQKQKGYWQATHRLGRYAAWAKREGFLELAAKLDFALRVVRGLSNTEKERFSQRMLERSVA